MALCQIFVKIMTCYSPYGYRKAIVNPAVLSTPIALKIFWFHYPYLAGFVLLFSFMRFLSHPFDKSITFYPCTIRVPAERYSPFFTDP
jgi:hypothetical protein